MNTPTSIQTATVDRAIFAKTLAQAIKACERKTSNPILTHALVEVDGQTLSLTCTDMDIWITATCPAVVSAPFVCTLDAYNLNDLVKKAKNVTDLVLTVEHAPRDLTPAETDAYGAGTVKAKPGDNGTITVGLGALKTGMLSFPPFDFPRSRKASGESHAFSIATAVLFPALSKCLSASSTEETRYYLNGVYWHSVGSDLAPMVATDGHRLIKVDIAQPKANPTADYFLNGGMIIPNKTVKILTGAGFLKGRDAVEIVDIVWSNEQIVFRLSAAVTLITKVIDDGFPDYARVIPAEDRAKHFLTFNRESMLAAVSQVATICPRGGSAILLRPVNGRRIDVSANYEGQSMETVVAADLLCTIEGEDTPVDISVNCRHLAEILSQFDGDTVTIAYEDASSPMLITSNSTSDLDTVAVLMPMRV